MCPVRGQLHSTYSDHYLLHMLQSLFIGSHITYYLLKPLLYYRGFIIISIQLYISSLDDWGKAEMVREEEGGGKKKKCLPLIP